MDSSSQRSLMSAWLRLFRVKNRNKSVWYLKRMSFKLLEWQRAINKQWTILRIKKIPTFWKKSFILEVDFRQWRIDIRLDSSFCHSVFQSLPTMAPFPGNWQCALLHSIITYSRNEFQGFPISYHKLCSLVHWLLGYFLICINTLLLHLEPPISKSF